VALARGGILQVVQEEKNGVLLNDVNPDAFSSALARLIAHPDEAIRFGKAARETILARFSADRMVAETLRLYERLVAACTI